MLDHCNAVIKVGVGLAVTVGHRTNSGQSCNVSGCSIPNVGNAAETSKELHKKTTDHC